ncbi:hypothetical protein TruAng_001895 [Truncatella angustata]|nr:hypothetical protein TruAng_001895 [Truncatella angustata]
MQFAVIATSLLAGLASAAAVAQPEQSPKAAPIFARDAYNCQGSGLCATSPNLKRDCDIAVNDMLVRNDDINYGSSDSGKSVDGAQRGHCKVFVAGPAACSKSGNSIWYDYQDIRSHGCNICGTKNWGNHNECRTTINYVL